MRDDLTRYLNRAVPESATDEVERVRAQFIRDAVRPQAFREKGGIRGMGDRPHLTQLVQEVWIKLERSQVWESRGHFLAAASQAARQVLVDEARRRKCRIPTTTLDPAGQYPDQNGASGRLDPSLPATLHDLLTTLEVSQPVAARIAGYRLFGGLPITIIAEVEGLSLRQVHRHWQFARAWLADRVQSEMRA
jgi:RNA polymerase sigma factor (TIGR02999 family)